MTDPSLDRLLGDDTPDPGCEATFAAMDQYVDAALRGEDVAAKHPDLVNHLRNCAACREDTEGLLIAVKNLETIKPPEPG